MKSVLSLFFFILILSSCGDKAGDLDVVGYKPVYVAKSGAFEVSSQAPTSFKSPGKMFLYQNFIFITDNGSGIHIIDNTDPYHPQKSAFIQIPGVSDVVVKNGVLLANNFSDLISLDISNPTQITLINRLKNTFPMDDQMYPLYGNGYFECVDTTKGYVIGWVKEDLHNPKCYR